MVQNKRLYKALNYRYRKSSRIHIVGYTDKVSLYMDSADLYLTKPGGISVTEAAIKQCPMLFINAVAGCQGTERTNMDFFLCIHSAVTEEKAQASCSEKYRSAPLREKKTIHGSKAARTSTARWSRTDIRSIKHMQQ